MKAKSKKAEAKHNAGLFMKIAVLVAFVGVSAVVAGIVFGASTEIESRAIADTNGVPANWSSEKYNNDIAATTSLSVKLIPGKTRYVQYTAKVSNEDSGNDLYVTHLASYMSSDGTDENGFMKLSGESLEYTYTIDDDDSWQKIDLTKPSKRAEAFKLAKEISIDRAGSGKNTAYFRFYVTPSDKNTKTLNDTVSLKIKNESGKSGYMTSAKTVAYQEEEKTTIAATTDTNTDSEMGNAYVKPLGESSYKPEIATVSGTIANGGMNENFLPTSIIIMVVAVIIFAICMGIYLPFKKY